MAFPVSSENRTLCLLSKMDKKEVFQAMESAMAVAAWRWPDEFEARRGQLVRKLQKPLVNLCFGPDETRSTTCNKKRLELSGNGNNIHHQMMKGRAESSKTSTLTMHAKTTPQKFVGVSKKVVVVPAGAVTGLQLSKASNKNPSGDVISKESCSAIASHKNNSYHDFSEEKLDRLAKKIQARYQQLQCSRKRSRVLAFKDAPSFVDGTGRKRKFRARA